MENSDSEYETEETVVLVELNGIIDTDLLLQPQPLTKILGIDTDEPLLQIGNCLFKGEYEDTLGTVVVYEPVDGSNKDGPESVESDFKFLCKTDTKLTMKRCFPQEKSMDNLKSAEVASPVAIQNDKPKKSVTASKMKNGSKKNIISKKKKLTKPMPKKFVRSKKNKKNNKINSVQNSEKSEIPEQIIENMTESIVNSKNDEMNLFENQNTEKSEQFIENMTELTADKSPGKIDAIPLEALNLKNLEEKVDQSKFVPFGNIELQTRNKQTEDPKRRRKRYCDEMNDITKSSGQNIEASATGRKLMKIENNEVQAVDKEIVTFDKDNAESNNASSIRNNAILSGTKDFESEADRGDEQMFEEESVIEALVSTVINNECKMQEKSTTACASEMDEEEMTEKSISKTLESTMANDARKTASVSYMDGEKRSLIKEEAFFVPAKLGDTIINNENEIQDKSTFANLSEVHKEPVMEEEEIIETVGNIVEANEKEIHKKSIFASASEMDKVEPVIDESITKVMETIVVNIENENQQKHVSILEVHDDKKFIVGEENTKVLNSTINNHVNVTHGESSHLNILDDGMSDSLAEEIEEASLVLKHGDVKDNTNCSSSSDMEHTKNENISEPASICALSDDEVLHSVTEILEKIDDNNASSSCQENSENILLEKIVVVEGNVDDAELITASDNLVGLNSIEKDDICVVSQSVNNEGDTIRKLDEFEGRYKPVNSAGELTIDTVDNLNPVSASDMIAVSITGQTSALSSRKHSSCEVTQSTNSEGEYLENKDLVSDYEVFSESLQDDNLEKNVSIEVDNEFQTADIKYSEALFKSDSIASEISQSCQESKFPKERSEVEFEIDGTICSQSTDQSIVLPEAQTEGYLCVSSCDTDDKTEFKENIEEDIHYNSGEDAEPSNCEESETNVICEVSQSDESENNISVLAESSESEAKILSNECEGSFSNTRENLNNTMINQYTSEITGSFQKAFNVPSTSSIHEVTQFSNIKNVKHSDMTTEENILEECDKNEITHAPVELSDDKLKYECVSSVDGPTVSETLLEIEINSDEKDKNSEVSQSFRLVENQQFNETCNTSHSKNVRKLGIEDIDVEFKYPSEVSQSVEFESSSLYNQQSDINEYDRTKSSSNNSVEYQSEICESSDDASNIESNSHVEDDQPVKNSMCEVSQSFRSEEVVLTTRHITDSEMESSNECEVYASYVEPEAETNKLNTNEKNICESSDDVNKFESEIVIDEFNEREKNICESSDDINETESEIIIDQISNREKNICESSDDINETESEIIIDQNSNGERNMCESSDDINEIESEIIIDTISDRGKNICESSDDVNETESEIIVDQLSEKEKNICESSDDISKKFGSVQQHTSIHLEEDISDEACHSSKFDENVLSANETKSFTSEENFTNCETSVGRSNIKNSTICESSEDTTSKELNNKELDINACTSSDKSEMDSSDAVGNLHDSKSFDSVVTVGEMENNQISQSSNVACDFMDTSVNGAENSMISQSGNSVNISIYKTLNESENCQISQSGGYLESVSVTETDNEISQSEGVTDCSNVVTLNETENNQISQSGCIINSLNNVIVEEIENDQISQSENTIGHLSDMFVIEVGNNQISQSSNNENASSEIILNEVENSQISQSGTVASCSADISITETENSLISQSGNVPIYSSDVSRNENENSQISQSGNAKEFLYDISINESDNNQISQSSSSSNLSSNMISREMGNNQISQSGNLTDNVSETENNQISQISQSSNSSGSQNMLSSNENENNQISQSECNDNIYQMNQTLPFDSSFQAEVVSISSSSDIVSSNYIDVTNSSFHVSNSTISSNSEVSPSLTNVRPHIWDRNSLITSVTTSEMRTSVLSSEQANEMECQVAQTSAHLAVSSCSIVSEENRENVTSLDQEMSSSNNINEIVESSLSLIHEEEEIIKVIPKDDSPMSVSESVVEEMPSTSQNLVRTDEDRIQKRETNPKNTNLRREDFQASVSGNSHLQKQYKFDNNLLQTSFLPCVSSQSDIGSNSSSARPSFLEVMASSASDFRNSLLSDNSFGKDKSHNSSVPESSGSNIGSCGEFSESFIREADGLVRNRSNDDVSHAPENLSVLADNSDPAYSEVSRSSGVKRKYSDSGEFGYSHYQVSQSSDVVNSLSSTSRTHALIPDNSHSSQQDFVQSSSNILRTSVLVSNDSMSVIDQVSSADENTSFISRNSENADILESSIGVDAAVPSCSQNTFSLANSNQLIESSSDQPTFIEDTSDFKSENTESEVSSTPSETQYTGFKILTDGKRQLSVIQGNIIILPGTSHVIDESDVDISTVEVTCPDSDYIPVRSDLNSETVLILDSSNEAEILNHSSVASPLTVQLTSFDQTALSIDASQARIASGTSGSPISVVEVVNYEENSEVSESLMANQNDISQSSLCDNNVSCSVSEFPTSHSVINTNYSFPDISQEAESKSSDECISSYHGTCDNILPVPNLQSSADREFYSHVGEFDDSVQSSLDETHMAINEQIKAISSPPNSSDSASCEEQRSLSINPFVTFSSQSHVFSTNYGATCSKITLGSNNSHEIALERDNLTESHQVITTTSNSDIIISSFDPELSNMPQSPQISGNICSPDQYIELSEQIVPAVQIAGADFVESSNDQLDDSQSLEDSTSQDDILNTDSES
ncbi:serine-rich adhesin for platelets-like [Argiope bruennichi]|uniref:serine-rich adhesin for platelets-like n=1 Tax=Argiope bruennichi TaxID=94029 RepID=UPI002495571A|nr:serine-rich adhesin for platelets-like [Argiope bruennichi]